MPIYSSHIDRMRDLLKSMDGADMYLILAAIRGPDAESEKEYKEITKVIRSYLGFDANNCAGDTMAMIPSDKFFGIKSAMEKLILSPSYGGSHYKYHLTRAIMSIGYGNISFFMDQEIERRDIAAKLKNARAARLKPVKRRRSK